MTKVYRRPTYPALENSNSVKNPDLLDIADKNYTSTILRYSNLAILYSQLNTKEKTIVGAINELKKDVPYILPPATTDTLGGVIVGNNLSVTEEGVLSADAQELVPATTSSLGGIIVGDNLTVTSEGRLSAQSGGSTYYSGTLTTIDNAHKINVNMEKSNPTDIENMSRRYPNTLFFTEGGVEPGTRIYTTTATLLANNWHENSQTVQVEGITATCHVIVSADVQSYWNYNQNGVYATSCGDGTMTFSCATEPTVNVTADIAYWEGDT